ncbi:MAG: hypothetical protein WCK86_08790 [Planctomycetia bacterium]
MHVLLVTTDLMLISSVGGAAQMAGHSFQCDTRTDVIRDRLSDDQTLLCVDLSAVPAGPSELASLSSPRVLQNAIAFGPHVHTARLEAASSAGFGQVLSRGQFVSRLNQLLAGKPS